MNYSIIAAGEPTALAPAVRRAMASIDGTIPLEHVETYAQFLHLQLTGLFYISGTLAFDAFLALLLAAIGIFGAMENMVGERTREIGVRLALGARRQDVLRMILGRAGRLTGVGLCVGLILAFGLARAVANLLYQVRPDDPLVFAGITVAIAAIALLASWIPARRASRVDPMNALRSEWRRSANLLPSELKKSCGEHGTCPRFTTREQRTGARVLSSSTTSRS